MQPRRLASAGEARRALAFVVVVLFGGFLRLAWLHTIPPGLFFDEAANLFDVSAVLDGWRPIYFPANNGREPLFFYWASLFASLWGPTPFAIRLAAATAGTLTLVTTFLCAREVFRLWEEGGNPDHRWADWCAIAATLVLAITYTHLHYSRFGLRTITLPLCLTLSYGLFLRGIRRDSWWAYTFAGLCGGLSIYTYISSRIAPALLAVPLIVGSRRPRHLLPRVLWVLLLWIVISIPLGVYTVRHPQDIQGHTADVSILNPVNNDGDPGGAVLHGVLATLAAINVVGAEGADQNLPGRPILDPVLSAFFAVGLLTLARAAVFPRGSEGGKGGSSGSGLWGARTGALARPRLFIGVFLIAWVISQLLPPMLSVSPPAYVRLTGALPALAIITALGTGTIARGLACRTVRREVIAGVLLGAMTVSTAWTVRDYFLVWGRGAVAYKWMMADKVDAASHLRALAATDRVFLAPLYAQDNTIRFLTREVRIDSFDLGQSLVVPTSRDRPVHYVFPASEPAQIKDVAAVLPVRFSEVTVHDPSGRFALLGRLDVRPEDLPPRPTALRAVFAAELGLVDATLPGQADPGQEITITTQWLALRPAPDDYTIYLHLRDAQNQTVAQTDRQPTNGSYPTSAWQPGDLVWDRASLHLPTATPPGAYHLVGGLYRLADQRRLEAQTPRGRAESDEVWIGDLEIR